MPRLPSAGRRHSLRHGPHLNTDSRSAGYKQQGVRHLTDPASLNDNWTLVGTVPGGWAVNTEVAIVYEIDAGPGLTNILASFALVDNGIHIWVNGAWKFSARDPVGTAWNLVSLGSVGPGTHYIQVLLEDSGGATSFLNPSITATVVPLPFAGWLFASALAALAGWRRGVRQA